MSESGETPKGIVGKIIDKLLPEKSGVVIKNATPLPVDLQKVVIEKRKAAAQKYASQRKAQILSGRGET